MFKMMMMMNTIIIASYLSSPMFSKRHLLLLEMSVL